MGNCSHKTLVSCNLLQISVIRIKWVTPCLFGSRKYFKEQDDFEWELKRKNKVQESGMEMAFKQWEEQQIKAWKRKM